LKIIVFIAEFLILSGGALALSPKNPSKTQSHQQQVHVIHALVAQAAAEKPLLEKMVTTKPELLPKSRIGQMLHAANDARLNLPGWDAEVLATLPSSDLEMEAFWEFTHDSGNPVFTPLFRTYYAKAFRAAGRHPSALHKAFKIAREYETSNWPDYDDIDWFCDQLKNSKSENPSAFDAALRSESHDMQAYVLGCVRQATSRK
jgi:hypothetical protein